MDDGDVRDQIGELEERIERLNESIARCRKISVGAKIAIAAGALWFAAFLVRMVYFDPTFFVAALTAMLGGVVLLGSNATTWDQTQADLNATEKMRADLIGQIELRLVSERPTLH